MYKIIVWTTIFAYMKSWRWLQHSLSSVNGAQVVASVQYWCCFASIGLLLPAARVRPRYLPPKLQQGCPGMGLLPHWNCCGFAFVFFASGELQHSLSNLCFFVCFDVVLVWTLCIHVGLLKIAACCCNPERLLWHCGIGLSEKCRKLWCIVA